MKLIILRLNVTMPVDGKNLELIQLHRMINEGVLLLDARFEEPLVIDIESEQKHYGKSAEICFADESWAIEQINKEKETLLEEKKERQARTIKKVEKALGLTLFDWQKEYIFEGKEYGAEIKSVRRAGKTLAHILKICLSNGELIKATLKPACLGKNEFLQYLGEDGCTDTRAKFFIHELREVYEKLKAVGGIDLREIEF